MEVEVLNWNDFTDYIEDAKDNDSLIVFTSYELHDVKNLLVKTII